MKNIYVKMFGVAATILLLAVFTQILVSGQNSDKGRAEVYGDGFSGKNIEGVWQTTITQYNCQTGQQIGAKFQGLLTFNQGGTVTEIAAASSPALRSAGHGIWTRENGSQRYSGAFIFLRFSPTGAFIGTQKVGQVLEIHDAQRNEFFSSGYVEVLDPNGNTLGTGCANSTGKRFE